jgi:ubiquinone/menaquinone biosynthesis C-methylase UbiE
MAARQSNLGFRLMAAEFRIRDLLWPRRAILEEAGIGPDMCVLDYGCGPGSYVVPAAEMVGRSGKVYALDLHPLAIASVRKLSLRKRLTNVLTICSHCQTGLADGEVDVVLLYDVLHDVRDPGPLLDELHRVLKPKGVLSVSDHHLRESGIVSLLTRGDLFRLLSAGKWTCAFSPQQLPVPSPVGREAGRRDSRQC